MIASLATAFGTLAICLAAMGLYGVLAYAVSRRTREIGIRIALGASLRSVLWIVSREALTLVGAGTIAGLAAAIAMECGLGSFLGAMPNPSPLVLIGCTILMTFVATVAISIPAIRACRIDPLVALRYE